MLTNEHGAEAVQAAKPRYHSVNGVWPDDLPPISDEEAIRLVKRLYRFAMKRPLRMSLKITSGNRNTWPRGGVFYVNPKCTGWTGGPDPGWQDIVHHVSHYCHHRLFPGHKPHDGRGTHAFLERSMIDYVVKSGFLDGKLKSKPKAPKVVKDPAVLKAERRAAAIVRWERKLKRAQNALRKLRTQQRRSAAQQARFS